MRKHFLRSHPVAVPAAHDDGPGLLNRTRAVVVSLRYGVGTTPVSTVTTVNAPVSP